MDKTLKQISDDLRISKQKLYRYVKKNNIIEVNQNTSMMYFDEKAQKLIYKAFAKTITSNDIKQITLNDTIIDVLSKQATLLELELQSKNKQIEALTDALVSAQRALNDAQALHAGTIQKLLEKKSSFKFWKRHEQ